MNSKLMKILGLVGNLIGAGVLGLGISYGDIFYENFMAIRAQNIAYCAPIRKEFSKGDVLINVENKVLGVYNNDTLAGDIEIKIIGGIEYLIDNLKEPLFEEFINSVDLNSLDSKFKNGFVSKEELFEGYKNYLILNGYIKNSK